MKLTSKALAITLSAGLFLTSCGGDGSTDNTLYYNNSTRADTEGYTFLKTVSHEANYQQLASAKAANAQLANEIKTTYAEIAKEIHVLSDAQDVLTPQFAKLSAEELETLKNEDLVKSQEVIIGQFKMVLHNTNVEIAEYAKKTLPRLEELLNKTKQ